VVQLRILQVVQGFPPEFTAGTELYCHALSQALQERGHRCFVLAGSHQQTPNPALLSTEEEGIYVARYVSPLAPVWREQQIDSYDPEAEALLFQYAEMIRPDVMHVHHWHLLTNTTVSAATTLGIPTVVTLHDLWISCARIHRQHRLGHFCQEPPSPSLCAPCVERLPWQKHGEIERALALRQEQIDRELRLARLLLVPSEAHRQMLSHLVGISPERFRVVPHGSLSRLTPHRVDSASRFPQRPLRLAYWGYVVWHKGVHLLLEAVRRLRDPSAVEVFLIGDTPDADYAAHLQELAAGLTVTFSGKYQPSDLARLDVDLAVFPSLAYESYGFVLSEAFQLGLPVIVSDRGALAARAGEAGLAFAAGDAQALANRIQEILDTPALLERMKETIATVLPPSMEDHAQIIEAAYQEALNAPAQPPTENVSLTSRRLAALYTRLAARDQEILKHSVALKQQEAGVAQQRELQKDEALRRQTEEFQHKEEQLRQQEEALQRKEEELQKQRDAVAHLERRLQEESAKVQALEQWVQRIFHSVGWRILDRFYYLREHFLAPPGTRRGKVYDLLKRAGVAYRNGGLEQAVQETREQIEFTTTSDPYQLWLERNALTSEKEHQLQERLQALAYQPTVSIIMPVYNTEEVWLRKAIESVQRQLYQRWELCICDDHSTAAHIPRVLTEYAEQDERVRVVTSSRNGGISAASNNALALATGEFVGFLDHDDELTPDALAEVIVLLNEKPELDFIYTDEDKITVEGRREEPFFKPDWSPDLLLSMNYIAHFSVVRRSLVLEVGGFTEGLEGSQDYDLFLRLTEKTDKIGHIARPLYSWRKIPHSTAGDTQAKPYAHMAGQRALQAHLQRRGIAGEVLDGLITPFRYRVRYHISGQPLVSILIPTKDRLELLKGCIDSIEKKTAYRRFELIILDNQSERPETLAYLASSPHRVVPAPGPFNYSHINNLGAAQARGDFLLFLNNDTEVITEEWLTAMLEHAQRREVGAVGAKLLFPNRTIQHGGVVLGCGGFANHAFWGQADDQPGYCCLSHVVRNVSAVTGACLMTKKAIFEEIKGFDENLTVAFGDVDLCLRMREKGYVIVFTPHAVLYHLESASRKKLHPMEDEEYARRRWSSFWVRGDPYYNVHLSRERFDFSLRVLDHDQK
jgi:GT2 family glycosyltransferase/glycosyltransferase involved in cell wall biosynthesis